jgi:PDZ domain-containing protein
MALAILDDLTPGNLTGGTRVAVTGTIGYAGTVGEIGGIEQKAVAARAAGARLFIVPACTTPETKVSCETDLQRATKRVGAKVKVVAVQTFDEALRVLRQNGGDAVQRIGPDTKAA